MNARLSASERDALLSVFSAYLHSAYLYGSRLDLSRKGGDIDVLVLLNLPSEQDAFRLSQKLTLDFQKILEQKIDITIINEKTASPSQLAFLKTLKKCSFAVIFKLDSAHPNASSHDRPIPE